MTTFEKSFSRYTKYNFVMPLLLSSEIQGIGRRIIAELSKSLLVTYAIGFIKHFKRNTKIIIKREPPVVHRSGLRELHTFMFVYICQLSFHLCRPATSSHVLFVENILHSQLAGMGRGVTNAAQCDTYLPQKRERGFWFPPLAYIRGLPLFPRNI